MVKAELVSGRGESTLLNSDNFNRYVPEEYVLVIEGAKQPRYCVFSIVPSWNSTLAGAGASNCMISKLVVFFTLSLNISLSLSSSAIIGVSEFDISVVSYLSMFSLVSIN